MLSKLKKFATGKEGDIKVPVVCRTLLSTSFPLQVIRSCVEQTMPIATFCRLEIILTSSRRKGRRSKKSPVKNTKQSIEFL